jgi:hypothetical protein
MQTYLERYLQGEHVDVWAELVGIGSAVRDDLFYSDAQAVAREMMTRAKYNVSVLVERLKLLNYRFVKPDRAWVPPDAKHLSFFQDLEQRHGPFPLTIHMWCEIVGSVNFMGAHPKLSKCHDFNWGGSDQLKFHGDPIVVWTMDRQNQGLVSFYLNRAASEEEEARMEAEMPPPFGLEIGLTRINKAGESGGSGVDMLVPNSTFDAPLIDSDSYWTGTFFIPYLRACFEYGGFPGLNARWYPDQQWDPEYSKTELDFLTKDLLPL